MAFNGKAVKIIDQWAARHPKPDAPALLTGMGIFSPRQIIAAIKNNQPVGKLFMKMIVHNSKTLPIDEVLKRLEGNNPPELTVTK